MTHKTAIVTGAGSGIGRAAAMRLLADGWTVGALDRSEQALSGLGEEARSADRLRLRACDVTSAPEVDGAIASVLAGEPLHALVCCAGIIKVGPVGAMAVEDFDQLFAVNTRGPWLCIRAALPALKASATEGEPARVVVLSSISAHRPKVGSGVYAATKVAVTYLVRVLAAEHAADRILLNAIAPGTVNTPFIRPSASLESASGGGFRISGSSPLGRVAEPDDIVDTILFLLGPAARYTTGTTITVDGGTSAAFQAS